ADRPPQARSAWREDDRLGVAGARQVTGAERARRGFHAARRRRLGGFERATGPQVPLPDGDFGDRRRPREPPRPRSPLPHQDGDGGRGPRAAGRPDEPTGSLAPRYSRDRPRVGPPVAADRAAPTGA